jgi:hypothetical protein
MKARAASNSSFVGVGQIGVDGTGVPGMMVGMGSRRPMSLNT